VYERKEVVMMILLLIMIDGPAEIIHL